jgi:peptide/nickel transport system substrate-binding protein
MARVAIRKERKMLKWLIIPVAILALLGANLVGCAEEVTGETVAKFFAAPTSGTAPLEVDFTDQSESEVDITAWEWDFDNDGTVDSTEQNPTHTYDAVGEYTISLKVTDADDETDRETKIDYIEAKEEEQPTIKNPTTFVQATIGDPDSLDGAYAYDTASAENIQSIYDPLLWFDGTSTSEFVPALATEWTISEDGMTYRFKIRQGVTFHNGNTLTPEDVEYSFERGMVQDYGAGPQWMILEPLLGIQTTRPSEGELIPLEDITNAVEVDGDWVQFNLVAPYQPFLAILAQSWSSIVDKEWAMANDDWDGTQASYEELNDPPSGGSPLQDIANGTGPFMLDYWDVGVEIVLVRNDDYWGGPAPLERFIYKVIDEWTTRKLELLAGDADWAYVPRANIGELEGVEGLTVFKDLPQMQADAFFFQFDISEESTFVGSGQLDGNGIPLDFFTDDDLRLGFAYAFDYDTMIEDGLLGEAQRIASPVIDGLPYRNPEAPMYSLDLVKAEEHLRAAWGGEVWENGFILTLAYNSGNDTRKIACEILQANLFQINENFRVNIQVTAWPTLLRGMYNGLLPMFMIGWLADYPDPHNFVTPYMHSNGTFSGWQNYSNPEVDALIADGIAATTAAERQAIYYELADLYYDDVPSFILFQPLGRRYFRSWVQGYFFNPIDPADIGHYYKLSKEYLS